MASTTPSASLSAFGPLFAGEPRVALEPLGCSLEDLVRREVADDPGFVAALLRGYEAQAAALRAVLQAHRLGVVDLPPALVARLDAARRETPSFLTGSRPPA